MAINRPEPRPTQLLVDLIKTHWDYSIDIPDIVEVPLEDAPRIDLTDVDYILISMLNFSDELIHIGFKNRDITIDMQIEFHVASGRQRLYDYVQEVRRIIYINQHDPTVYLIDDFERYDDSGGLSDQWIASQHVNLLLKPDSTDTGRDIVSALSENTHYMRCENNNQLATISKKLPYDIENETLDELNPARLRSVLFYGRVDSSGDEVIRVRLGSSADDDLWREWNIDINNEWKHYRLYFDSMANGNGAAEWDIEKIDMISFVIPSGVNNLDIDYIQLSTQEYQFLMYKGFSERPNTFEYWNGNMTCAFRDVGQPIDRLM